jgi:hypothetical protein
MIVMLRSRRVQFLDKTPTSSDEFNSRGHVLAIDNATRDDIAEHDAAERCDVGKKTTFKSSTQQLLLVRFSLDSPFLDIF